jgi:3-keto-disaccharide hydrolase
LNHGTGFVSRSARMLRSIVIAVWVGVGLSAVTAAVAGQDARGEEDAPQNTLTEQERAEGWELLFDGQTMDKWRGYKMDAVPDGWAVRDQSITRVGPGGDLVTREVFDDFELSLEWKISEGGNSGIFFHVSEDYDHAWESAPEMQVLDNTHHSNGSDPRTSAGANYALHAPSRDVTRPVGEFNRAVIIVRGHHVEHHLNGVKLLEYELGSEEWEALVAASKFGQMPGYGRSPRGHIALQDHGDPVSYRNIKIRRLDAAQTQPEASQGDD